jgi:DNA end-binding protein Ku
VPTGSTGEPTRGEVAEAVKLIDAMTLQFDPAGYENRYRARLTELIESKHTSKRTVELPVEDEATPAPAPDLMAALKASLERARRD